MQIYQLGSFPIDQIDEPDRLAWSLGEWFKDRPYPVRLLAFSRSFDMRPARAQLDRQVAELGGPRAALSWRLPWLREAQRFYDALAERHLRRADYLLVTWEPGGVSAAALATSIRRSFRREPQSGARIPAVLAGSYLEQDGFLQPEQPGAPYLAGLISYDMRGEIDLGALHDLISLPYDLSVAIDIQTRPVGRVLALTERSFAVSRAAADDGRLKDARAERQAADAERALHELVRQNLHDVQIGVLVSAPTRAALETRVAEVGEVLGGRLKLTRPLGVQREILSLWSTRQAAQIDIPWRRRNIYSHGVGCLAGVVTYHRPSQTDGLLWGIDSQRMGPLMLDLFADRRAAHVVVLGMTGSGKTYFLNTMALRAAALAGYRVVMIDAFANAERVQRAVGDGARGNWLSLETPINLLDIVFDESVGDWRAAQVEHVISQLALLLGTLGTDQGGRKCFRPRLFQPEERGVLDRALSNIYAELSPDTPADQTPLLEELIAALDAVGEPEGLAIADTLSKLLFGSASRAATAPTRLGQRFNAHTAIDWRFARGITCFDLSAITATAPEWLPFYYAQVIGAVNRDMRDRRRDRAVPTMLVIDEFGYAAQVESVARLAADICKVARKYAIGLVVADQNPHTFQSATGREIFENAAAKILFRLERSAAATAGELIADLTLAHRQFLGEAQRGETVAVFGNDVYLMNVETSPLEHRQLSGS